MIVAIYVRKSTALWCLTALAITGCGKYYYSKPSTDYADFREDSHACASDFGIKSGNGQYVVVSPDLFRRCMLSKGWQREKRVEPGSGWYRGVEDSDPVSLADGPRQPNPTSQRGSQIFCRARHLDNRGDWRERLPAYRECLGR